MVGESRFVNPFALRMAKTQKSFGHSECKRVKALKLFNSNNQGASSSPDSMKQIS